MASLMTYEQVEALCEWLEGPEGCHFRPHPRKSDDFTWNCDHSLKLTKKWLKRHKLDVDANVEALQACGGYCDCEVVFNVLQSWER